MNIAKANEVLRSLAHYSMFIAGFMGIKQTDSGPFQGCIYIDGYHICLFAVLSILAIMEPALMHRTDFYSILDFLGVPPALADRNELDNYLSRQYDINADKFYEQENR